MTSADSCRKGGIKGVGTVELEYVGRLWRMDCDSLLMPVLVMGNCYGSRMGYYGSILFKTNGRGGEGGQERLR